MGIIFTGMNGALAISQDIGFSLPHLISLERDSNSVLSSSATTSGVNTLTLDNPITFTYNITNSSDERLSVKISALNSNTPLGSVSIHGANIIAFTKSDKTQVIASINVENNEVGENKNTIAFPVTCTDGFLTRNELPPLGSDIQYRIEVGDEKEISCSISGEAIEGTFGMNDEPGEYNATIQITSSDL